MPDKYTSEAEAKVVRVELPTHVDVKMWHSEGKVVVKVGDYLLYPTKYNKLAHLVDQLDVDPDDALELLLSLAEEFAEEENEELW